MQVVVGIAECGMRPASATTRQFLELHTPADTEVRELRHAGALAFNELVAESSADVHVLLDNDVLVGPGWLERLLDPLARLGCGLAGPSTNWAWNEQAVIERAGPGLPTVRRDAALVAQRFGNTVRSLAPLYSLGAFCYAVHRAVVDAIGVADPAYGEGPCWEMDYNVRAARAGFAGAWVTGAYVFRPAQSAERSQREATLLERNRRVYQDRFCGLRRRGELTEYRPHCLGDACEHFAITIPPMHAEPAAEPIPTTAPEMASTPLVSCLMVTRDRPDFALQSIRYFLDQEDCPHRELVIIEDGPPRLAARIPNDPRIRLVSSGQCRSIGAMRNHSVELARGDILILWDDDDWHGPRRIATQVAPLLAGNADLTALTDLTWLEIGPWRAWRLEPPLARRLLLHECYCGTLAFYRRVWDGGARFDPESLPEDAPFLRAALSRGWRLDKLRGGELCVYVRHGANSWQIGCGRTLLPRAWREVPVPDLPAPDLAFLRRRGASPTADAPLVSCLMPTYNRRRFVERAMDYFLRQTWAPRELVVVDDSTEPVADLVEAHADAAAQQVGESVTIRYHRLAQRTLLGSKRNISVSLASGDVLAHWDDDDWYPTDRLATQVSQLLANDALLCGTPRIPFYDPLRRRAIEYSRPPRGRPWLAGTSLVYRRRLWEDTRFPDVATGEDTRFVWQAPPHQTVTTEHPNVIALVHPGNTVTKAGLGSCWAPIPVEEVEATLGDDLAFYQSLHNEAQVLEHAAQHDRPSSSVIVDVGCDADRARRDPGPGRFAPGALTAANVDDQRSAPATAAIGIAITTRNRRAIYERSIRQWHEYLPPGAVLVVVDDASDVAAPGASVRFDKQRGIARAKNAGIEALMNAGCEHLFLADDDTWPVKHGWADLYIDAGEPHLMYLFKDVWRGAKPDHPPTIYNDGLTYALTHPRGCLLYLHRRVVDKIGGMRSEFGVWGNEHVEFSLRAFHAGLTSFPFQDACGSCDFVYACDEREPNIERSVDHEQRRRELPRSDALLAEFRGTTDCVDYRDLDDVVITTLFSRQVDPQRGTEISPEVSSIGKWLASLQDCRPVILHDEMTTADPNYVKVPTALNPYLQRWISVFRWLRDHPCRRAFATDGTDVELLHAPWPHMQPGWLYVGHENNIVGIPWMLNHHAPYREWIEANADRQLLNAGVVGADRPSLLEFCHDMVKGIAERPEHGITDMALFNMTAYQAKWRDRLVWGSRVVTKFKDDERNDFSWFKHK